MLMPHQPRLHGVETGGFGVEADCSAISSCASNSAKAASVVMA